MKTPKQIFLEKVDKNASNGCWEWMGALAPDNYGRHRIGKRGNRKRVYAHRFSYELFKGPIPEGLCVCHTCDNPRCVNPDHLWLGTISENIKDATAKGRIAHGPKHGSKTKPERISRGIQRYNSKLTPRKVKEIRSSLLSPIALAKKYSVNRSTIDDVLKFRTWKQIS